MLDDFAQFSSATQSCPPLCNLMDCSIPGFPVDYQLLKLAQIHVHWVGVIVQSSHLLLSPSPPGFNLSQYQGLFPVSQFFASSGKNIEALASALVLPRNVQDWFPLRLTDLIFLKSKGLSRVFPNAKVQKHHFFDAQLSLWSNSHIHTWLLEKP